MNKAIRSKGILLIVVLLICGYFDQYFSEFFFNIDNLHARDIMKRSYFEGAKTGVSDIPVFLLSLSLLVYIFTNLFHSRLILLRFYSGYVTLSAFIYGMVIIHGIKFALGRVRPYDVFVDQGLYTPVYQFGKLIVDHSFYNASFPSGHTATMMVPALFFFPLMRKGRTKLSRTLALILIVLSVASALVMGAARSISHDHWVADWAGSIVLGLFFFDHFYQKYQRLYSQCANSRFWEAKYFLTIFLRYFFVVGFVYYLRTVFSNPDFINLLAVLVCGVCGALVFMVSRNWWRSLGNFR